MHSGNNSNNSSKNSNNNNNNNNQNNNNSGCNDPSRCYNAFKMHAMLYQNGQNCFIKMAALLRAHFIAAQYFRYDFHFLKFSTKKFMLKILFVGFSTSAPE